MISNKDLVLYACVAKGSTIVAEFCREPELADTAHGCVSNTPPHHSTFSHTEKNRTYTFLIDVPFAYFSISGEDLDRSELLRFLNQLNHAFRDKIGKSPARSSGELAGGCFQALMDPFFRETLEAGFAPAEHRASEGLKKKASNVEGREFTVEMMKNSQILFPGNAERQRAEQVFRRHVAVVLLLDLTLCSLLFGIWVWVCRGFQCMDTWN